MAEGEFDDEDYEMTGSDGKSFVLGLGCERGTSPQEAIGLAERALKHAGIRATQLIAIATIESRKDEPAILGAATYLGLETLFFPAERLEEETPRLKNPSELVFAHVGCHGVAESAALAAAGKGGVLVVEKIKSGKATAAVARRGDKL